MRKWRRKYYDIFSKFYDWVIKLHSKDKSEALREYLIKKAEIISGYRVLDICTGTGSVAIKTKKLCPDCEVYGLDFSKGMLDKAKAKDDRVNWVLASVTNMPFKENSFDVVLCSHAFYELKGLEKFQALEEIKRVLKPQGKFLMMEHEVPKNGFIKLLYYIRLASMGSADGFEFVKKELEIFKKYFKDVKKDLSPTGRSKVITGIKE